MRPLPIARVRRSSALLLATLVLFPAVQAHADVDRCVDTVAELQNALATAYDNGDATIRVVQGNYPIDTVLLPSPDDLYLVGGYSDASCTTRSLNPNLTVIRPAQPGAGLDLRFENIRLESVKFSGFRFAENGSGVFLFANGDVLDVGTVRLDRVILDGPGHHAIAADRIFARQIIVQASGGGIANCALILQVDDNDDIVALSQSSFGNYPGKGACIRAPNGVDENFKLYLDNNVFWGNDPNGVDLEIRDTANLRLRHNLFGSFTTELADATPADSYQNVFADPQYVNAAANDFRVSPGSLAIDGGTAVPYLALPQADIIGNPRNLGFAPDRGAHESSVDASQILVVTSTADTNTTGTLRWAMNQANIDPSLSVIQFNIPGACPRQIELQSPLPKVLSRIRIDGYTQPGSSINANALGGTDAQVCVVLNGDQSTTDTGLHLPLAAGTTANLNVRGLAFGEFTSASIHLEAGVGSIVTGNQFGFVGNQFIGGSPIHVLVSGSASDSQIGGPEPAQINVFQNADAYAVALNPFGTGNIVENNLFGLAPSGNAASLSFEAVAVGISGNDNIVRNNAMAGINGAAIALFNAARNEILDNTLGRKVGIVFCGLPPAPPCDLDLANASHGILIQGPNSQDNLVQANQVANSGDVGIRITEGYRNFLLGNRIWNSAQLSVDLGAAGIEPVDDDTSPGTANQAHHGINAPRLSAGGLIGLGLSAGGNATSGTVRGYYEGANGTYVVQVFASSACPGGRGEARTLVGFSTFAVTDAGANGNGASYFTASVRSPNAVSLVGQSITTLASRIDPGARYGDSSELSGCRTYQLGDAVFQSGFE